MLRVPWAGLEWRSGGREKVVQMCTLVFQEAFEQGRGSEEAGVVPFVSLPLLSLHLSWQKGVIYWGFPAIRQRQQRWLH